MQVWLRSPGAESDVLGTTEDLLRHAASGAAQVFRYWDRKRAGRPMPSPDEIDFLELRPWLPYIMMIEVTTGSPRDLIYRVVGERAVKLRGYDPSGMSVRHAALGLSPVDVMAHYQLVVDRRVPFYRWGETLEWPADAALLTLALPLSRDGGQVDRILVYSEDLVSAAA